MPDARQLSIAEKLAERVARADVARAGAAGSGDALSVFADSAADDRVLANILPGQHLARIKVDLIEPSAEGQARQDFDEERLRALADSLKRSGVREPIIVTPHGAAPGHFQIVAGERRWRAAQLAGLGEIPCIVDPNLVDRREKLLAQAEENLHRENLNPVEEASVLAQLMESRGLDVRAAGELMGRSYIQARRLHRLHLAIDPIKQAVVRGDLDARAAVEVIRIYNALAQNDMSVEQRDSAARVEKLIERIAREKWSARRIEQYATKRGAGGGEDDAPAPAVGTGRANAADGAEPAAFTKAPNASLTTPAADVRSPAPILSRAEGRVVIEEDRIERGKITPEEREQLISVLEELLMRVRRV